MTLQSIMKILFFILSFSFSSLAFTYLGPGMGGGIIIVVFGFLVAIFLALWGIIYYPVKRALKKRADKNMPKKDKDKTTKH